MKKILKKITPFISIIFFGAALWFLHQELKQYEISEITSQLSDISSIHILISLVVSFLSYIVLTGYDALGVKYIGKKLAPGKIMRAGYVGYAFSHNIGLALITGGSIRYRIYSTWGFTGLEVTQIVGFSAFTLWIGFCMVAGLSLLFATPIIPGFAISYTYLRVLGVSLLLMVIGYLLASAKLKKEYSLWNWSFNFPSLSLAIKQTAIASADWLMAASVLYVILPFGEINFFSFVGVYLLAQIAGLFSQVPGGLGVFESIMLLYLSNFMPGSQALGILVVYRLVYYILPLVGALIVLGYQEYQMNRLKMKKFGEKAANWVPRVIPHVVSFSVFISGAILLFSGALPSEVPRMQWLQHFIPLPVIEMSHFLASLVGAALLVLAGALQRRVDAAYHLTVGLLVFGILFSLLKGVDYEEAFILAFMLITLLFCRKEFHRKASLFTRQYSAQWITMIFMVLLSAVWLGAFSYEHVEYQQSLWWQFTLMGDAPRYLRATVAALGFAIIIGLVKLLRTDKSVSSVGKIQLRMAKEVIKKSKRSISNMALLADKDLLFSESGRSFIMFRKEKKSYIALGDPVGPAEEAEELLWSFKEYCSENGARPAFLRVGKAYLDYYVDLGLTTFETGEEGRIFLNEFRTSDLDSGILQNYTKMIDYGYTWEMLPQGEATHLLPALKSISDENLQTRKRNESGFTVGYFDKNYLNQFPIALVRKDEQPVAFSNILLSGKKEEVSTDLLRYKDDVPHKIIDFIMIKTIKWAMEQNYQWFNLGMAPLSGNHENYVSQRWSKLASLIYTYGENMYGFRTVRTYKEKYHPQWEHKYLACPAGVALPGIITDLTKVISGGIAQPVSGKLESYSLKEKKRQENN